ncbi:MAG: L-histidine N(alpha)-methyltransferase [Pyrinomonadaceae bacterium]
MLPYVAANLIRERLIVQNLIEDGADQTFAGDVRQGLSNYPKQLLPKYLYDALGSKLFEAICLLPEYYLTRAENEILSTYATEIVEAATDFAVSCNLSAPSTLIELGSGSAHKTRSIIEALFACQSHLEFTPIDISASVLEESSLALLELYEDLKITAYRSDYHTALKYLKAEPKRNSNESMLVLFLGSNIGNFVPQEADQFLLNLREIMRPGDSLLVGADLKKSSADLIAAYDDPTGVTAAFNLNLLGRINQELEADFDLRSFKHIALYNEPHGRIEIYLESLCEQIVTIRQLRLQIGFTAGERILTEYSHKYNFEDLAKLAARCGLKLIESWTDAQNKFSSNLLTVTF